MLRPMRTLAAPPTTFTVRLPIFEGSLSELASALRSGQVAPGEVPLLRLTREVLSWVEALSGPLADSITDAQPELLPTLATVIAVKARLLLPPPEPDDTAPDPVDDLLDEVVGGVEALAELDALANFLATRRRERQGLLPARAVPLDLPRRERPSNPQGSLARLVSAARSTVRTVQVPLLARERLTLADALRALRAFGARLRTFTFRGVPTQDWGERTTYFAALLEGVKEGSFQARQDEIYGEIIVVDSAGSGETEPL